MKIKVELEPVSTGELHVKNLLVKSKLGTKELKVYYTVPKHSLIFVSDEKRYILTVESLIRKIITKI